MSLSPVTSDFVVAKKKPTVLLADDDPDIRELLAAAFRHAGYSVLLASSGDELLSLIADALLFDDPRRPDAIVSDQRMPGFVGTGILGGIRAAEWDTPFVLMTAFSDERLQCEAIELGVDAVFSKPFDVDDLILVVSNLLLYRSQRKPQRPPEH